MCKLFEFGEEVVKTFSLLEFTQLLVGFRSAVLILESVLESFCEVFPEGFVCLLDAFILFFFEFVELFFLPGVYTGSVHIAKHSNNPGEGFLHSVIVLIDCRPQVPAE